MPLHFFMAFGCSMEILSGCWTTDLMNSLAVIPLSCIVLVYCSVGFCRASWPLLANAKEEEFSFSKQELMLSFLICPSFGLGLWLTAQQQVDIDWPVSISWLERSEESFKLNSCGHTRLIVPDLSLESLTLFHTLVCNKALKRYPRVWIILRR